MVINNQKKTEKRRDRKSFRKTYPWPVALLASAAVLDLRSRIRRVPCPGRGNEVDGEEEEGAPPAAAAAPPFPCFDDSSPPSPAPIKRKIFSSSGQEAPETPTRGWLARQIEAEEKALPQVRTGKRCSDRKAAQMSSSSSVAAAGTMRVEG